MSDRRYALLNMILWWIVAAGTVVMALAKE